LCRLQTKAEGRRQKAEGTGALVRRQKARRQKAEGRRDKELYGVGVIAHA
jgi:hypothetical protein